MSVTLWIVVSLLVIAAALWVVKVLWLSSRNVQHLVDKLDSHLAPQLYPLFVERCRLEDEDVVQALGGVRGIWRIHQDTGTLLTVAFAIRMAYREDALYASQEMVRNSIYLRILSWLAIFEALATLVVPKLPRHQAIACAHLYCDVNASLNEVLSILDVPFADRIGGK